MIKKIIMFSDHWDGIRKFLKTGSNLRLTYLLRKAGYEVKPVHHCMGFDSDEVAQLIDDFAQGEQILVCISTSFMLSRNTKNTKFIENSETDPAAVDVGDWWGADTFKWLVAACTVAKSKGHPVMIGGWALDMMNMYKLPVLSEQSAFPMRNAWGLDVLSPLVDVFSIGSNIDVVDRLCKGELTDVKDVNGTRFVVSQRVADFTDFASTPLPTDNILPGEALMTEIAAGCIFSCSFCDYAALGKRKTEFVRSYDSLKAEIIANHENFGTRVYTLTDNIVNDWDEKLRYLIRIREETGIDLRWVGYVRLDTIKTKEQAQLLADSGMAGCVFGIESFKKEAGPYIGKMTDKKRLIDNLYTLRDAVGDKCLTMGSFIAGLPTETKTDLYKTYEWLQSKEGRHLLDTYLFSALAIFHGNDDKNDINRARNHPFRDYVKDPLKPKNPQAWTSPWGTYGEFADLARYFNSQCKNIFGGFGAVAIHNLGIDIDDVVRIGRSPKPEVMKRCFAVTDQKLLQYKQSLLNKRD